PSAPELEIEDVAPGAELEIEPTGIATGAVKGVPLSDDSELELEIEMPEEPEEPKKAEPARPAPAPRPAPQTRPAARPVPEKVEEETPEDLAGGLSLGSEGEGLSIELEEEPAQPAVRGGDSGLPAAAASRSEEHTSE